MTSGPLDPYATLANDGHLLTPASLAEALFPGWERARHLTHLSFRLADVAAGRRRRLMVFMPPQNGKSELTSHAFPAYVLAHRPTTRIGLASYSYEWAKHWGYQVRNLCRSNFPDLGIGLAKDSKAAYRWNTPEGGGMYCGGIDSPWTGRPLDILIIDDPVKDYDEAQSPTIQARNWNWWTTVARARLRPDGAVILIQTRWHEEDLAGRLLRQMEDGTGEHWDVVCFPAIAVEHDALGRKPGEPLWPEKYPLEFLQDTRRIAGEHRFAAVWQQSPHVEGGNIVKRDWMRYYKVLPDESEFDDQLQSWDLSFDDTEGSDPVSGTVWARKGSRVYLKDRINKQMNPAEMMASIKNMSALHPRVLVKLIEKAASGPAVATLLQLEVQGIIQEQVSGKPGKQARFKAVAPLFEAGNVWLPDPSIAPWVPEYVENLCRFPKAAHDDDVDSTSQALARLMPGLWAAEKAPEKVGFKPGEYGAALFAQRKAEMAKRMNRWQRPPEPRPNARIRMLRGW